MFSFIELTNRLTSRRIAVAVDSIRTISDEGEYCVIRFKNVSGKLFGGEPERFPTAVVTVAESYDEIKGRIVAAGKQ